MIYIKMSIGTLKKKKNVPLININCKSYNGDYQNDVIILLL